MRRCARAGSARREGFTLVEVLVVLAVVALLIALLLPTLAGAREATRATACLSNLRQIGVAVRAYADEHDGLSPALGRPYSALPNWAIVVQESSGRAASGADLFSERSALVCPTVRAFYARAMTRTYAINATGHARSVFPTDPDDFDALPPAPSAHIRLERVERPAEAVLVVDSAIAPINGVAPPDTRTSSVLDFRQEIHVRDRLGRFHGARGPDGARGFNTLFVDGSARASQGVLERWREGLP